MAIVLNKPLVRELTGYPGVIVTLTPDGITLKVKRRHKSLTIPWAKVFGAAAMKEANEVVLLRGSDLVLKELGYNPTIAETALQVQINNEEAESKDNES